MVSALCGLIFAGNANPAMTSPVKTVSPTDVEPQQRWVEPYVEFHRVSQRVESQVQRNYIPEFNLIKNGNMIATYQVDTFGSRVLKEADQVFYPYRTGLTECIEKHRNEFQEPVEYSFEKFAWLMDSYVRLLVHSVGEYEEPTAVNGVRERYVVTDRSLYAYTQLALAYLQFKMDRQKLAGITDMAADKALYRSFTEIAHRVYRLDLNQKFDPEELLKNGPDTQPVFRQLAQESNERLEIGLEPLRTLARANTKEPSCHFPLKTEPLQP